MRLIDADELIERLLESRREETETTLKLERFIKKQPTIEPKPKRGRWKRQNDKDRKRDTMLIDYDDAVWRIAVQLAFEADMEYPGEHNPTEYTDVARAWLKGIPTYIIDYRHCPNCGAKLEK